ncbi:MAG: RNA polymerase sigma factor [Bacteroidia bacterium]|nr:RNA polymerase sigma factor [Bacteroidia bacterium]
MTVQPLFNPLEKNAHLIELCKKGDRRAEHQIYQKYLRAMSRVALRITGDEMEAEDVIQEAFVRAFRNLTNFKGEATFGAWLKRIVVNTSINHVKRRKAEFVPLEPERLEVVEDYVPRYVSTYTMEKIKEAVEMLPDGYRTVFSLYLFEGYDHQEIGNILNISEATSKSQFSRAKKKLRELLAAA